MRGHHLSLQGYANEAIEYAAADEKNSNIIIDAIISALGSKNENVWNGAVFAFWNAAKKTTKTRGKIVEGINVLISSEKFLIEMEKNSDWFINVSGGIDEILSKLNESELRDAA